MSWKIMASRLTLTISLKRNNPEKKSGAPDYRKIEESTEKYEKMLR